MGENGDDIIAAERARRGAKQTDRIRRNRMTRRVEYTTISTQANADNRDRLRRLNQLGKDGWTLRSSVVLPGIGIVGPQVLDTLTREQG